MTAEIGAHLRAGRLNFREDISHGPASTPAAFARLMSGCNQGKALALLQSLQRRSIRAQTIPIAKQSAPTAPPAAQAEWVPPVDRVPVDIRRTTLEVRDTHKSLAFHRDALELKLIYDMPFGAGVDQGGKRQHVACAFHHLRGVDIAEPGPLYKGRTSPAQEPALPGSVGTSRWQDSCIVSATGGCSRRTPFIEIKGFQAWTHHSGLWRAPGSSNSPTW